MLGSAAAEGYGALVRFLGIEVHVMVCDAVPFGELREENQE